MASRIPLKPEGEVNIHKIRNDLLDRTVFRITSASRTSPEVLLQHEEVVVSVFWPKTFTYYKRSRSLPDLSKETPNP
jgi:hypothetical protein